MDLSGNPIQGEKGRCGAIWSKAIVLPKLTQTKPLHAVCLDDFRVKKVVDAMRLAGYEYEKTQGAGGTYRSISRFLDGMGKKANAPEEPRSLPPPVIDVDVDVDVDASRVSLFSPVSTLSGGSETQTLASRPNKSSSSLKSAFSKLTTLPETRRTAKEAQAGRAIDMAWKDAHRVAYKVGSTILSEGHRNRLHIKELNNAEKIATGVNQLFGIDLLVGNELKRCVKDNRVGKSPPRTGPQSRVAQDDFNLLVDLVFTCQSIEQANCDPNRLDRPRMRSAVSEIVNSKLLADGEDELNAVAFYRRIQDELSRVCKISSCNHREALRAAWLTWYNQNKHYVNWEFWLVELGFSRWPVDAEEKAKHGNVVFFKDQERRLLQYDEMGFSLDGSKNGKGGREAAVLTNPNIPEPKQPTNKSSQKVTCLFGMNFKKEAIPPLFVLASNAKGTYT